MRTEQRAVLTKHRKPPDSTEEEKQSVTCAVSLEGDHLNSTSPPEEYKSMLGWSRAAVSKAPVSKKGSPTQTGAVALVHEKGIDIESMTSVQNEKYVHRGSQERTLNEKSQVGDAKSESARGIDERNPAVAAAGTANDPSAKSPRPPIPIISIDKPLPPSPTQSLSVDSTRAASPPANHLNADSKGSSSECANPTLFTPSPSVRRIKSYGDLLCSTGKSSGPSAVERRASNIDLRSQDSDDTAVNYTKEALQRNLLHEEALLEHVTPTRNSIWSSTSTLTPHSGSSAGGFLKKRSSSLGLGRRPSATSTETVKASDQASPFPPTATTARNVSSATAPPSTRPQDLDAQRKRKPSMFSGLFSGLWKAKTKDSISTSSPDLEPSSTNDEGTSLMHGNPSLQSLHTTSCPSRVSSSASLEASVIKSEAPHGLLVPPMAEEEQPDSPNLSKPDHQARTANQPRRHSILHNLFRSAPSGKAANTSDSAATKTPTPPTSSTPDFFMQPDTVSGRPLDIPPSSLPQLPSISQDLGDISFGPLFETGERRSRGRSRASTRGSVHSFFFASTGSPSASGYSDPSPSGSPKIGSPRSRSNSQLQQSITASELALVQGSGDRGAESETEAPCAIGKQEDQDSDLGHSIREQPKGPGVSSILAGERRRTRLFRSNSASSITTSSWNTASSDASRPNTRPDFMRARSSSTISNSTTTRILTPLPEGAVAVNSTVDKSRSPAIMVTGDHGSPNPFFMDFRSPAHHAPVDSPAEANFDILSRASRSSSVSTGIASPALDQEPFTKTSHDSARTDANLADAMTDFVLTPPGALDMRTSADSQTSARSSFSDASSLLSSSPLASAGASQGGRASSIINKTLRRRANTMGPLLATSLPIDVGPVALGNSFRGAGSLDTPEILNRPGRSGSSSRLSSFFGSPASTLSSSPTESSGLWLAPRDMTKVLVAGGRELHSPRSVVRRLSASLLASPRVIAEEERSNISSPRLSASTLADSQEFEHDHLGENAPIPADAGKEASANRSRLSPSAASDVQVHILPGDTSATFLTRVKFLAGPQDVARLLSEKSDSFYGAALRLYLQEYDFVNDAIDIAIRKLLLGLHLPRETQQIDRVMQAFAERYNFCNPALFTSPDQPYILAFSIIMLHTDAFNKSNKKKMTRADYVKNTKVEGIPTILLEYIYDNTIYAPFIYADEKADLTGVKKSTDSGTTSSATSNPGTKERAKLEVYRNIAGDQLSRFRIDMGLLVPIKNPFSYTGTVAFFDCSILRNAFRYAHTIEVPHHGELPDMPLLPGMQSTSVTALRVARVGVLERKDDMSPTGKKASSRKWKSWGVLLLEGQLLFFRDATIALDLHARIVETAGEDPPQTVDDSAHLVWRSEFRPDEIVSLDNVIVLYDFTYTRYTHVFRCIQPDGRQILLRASSDLDLNLWMSTINYAATFRTAGIRLLPPSSGDHTRTNMDTLPQAGVRPTPQTKLSTATSIYAASVAGSDPPIIPREPQGSTERLASATIESQMQDLMFPRIATSDLGTPARTLDSAKWYATRGDIERSKIMELEDIIRREQTELASDIRLVRNIAILTPFNGATRRRLQQAAETVARRIRRTRQSIAKTICYRECLCRDLLATERDAHRQRFRQSTSSSHSNLRSSQGQQAWLGTGPRGDNHSTAASNSKEPAESSHMAKSASQDEIASLVRSPSLLKRSLTADMQHNGEVSTFRLQRLDFDARNDDQYKQTSTEAATGSGAGKPTAFSAKFGVSPTLGSGTFETVKEDSETSTQEVRPSGQPVMTI